MSASSIKIIVSSLILLSTASCSQYQVKEAVYNTLQNKQRQDCLQQGNMDCPQAERFQDYNQKRDEVINPGKPEQ